MSKKVSPGTRCPVSAAVEHVLVASRAEPSGLRLTRRRFIERAAGSSMAIALPAGLAACGNGTGTGDGDGDTAAEPLLPQPQVRTLFVNLSHEAHQGKRYWLTGGGKRYPVVPCSERPELLEAAKSTSQFLRAVPSGQLTHLVEGVQFAADSVTLAYVSSELNAQAGTWSMSSVQLLIPPAAAATAFARAANRNPGGALPLSAKRRFYGLPPAMTEQDLMEERDLLDSVSHAATLIGCHPDLMSLEPGAAYTVQSNHIGTNIGVTLLSARLTAAGPALPESNPGQPNATGWATLVPVRDGDGLHGAPLMNRNGLHKGYIQYQPSTHPSLRDSVRNLIIGTIPTVKNDPTLGADITALVPAAGGGSPNPQLAGVLWMRHDGSTRVDQSAGAGFDAADASEAMRLTRTNPQSGFAVSASSSRSGDTTTVKLTLISWFLEFRGVYLQFLDANSKVLPLKSMPEYQNGTITPNHDNSGDETDAMLLTLVGPVFTVFAIPVAPGFATPSFKVPEQASTVRILSSGLSFQGGNVYQDTVVPGAVMTGLINYGMTTILAAAGGAQWESPLLKAQVIPVMQGLALEYVAVLGSALPSTQTLVEQMGTPQFWEKQGLIVGKLLVTVGTGVLLKNLVTALVVDITESTAEDSVPVVGQVMQAISVVAGLASLAETSIELATAPWTYVDDLVFTHDVSLTLKPDPNDNTFPKAADNYTVTALFDDGTPYVQTLALAGAPSVLPPVVFRSVPVGGNVNLSVAFVQKAMQPGQPDVLLGKGSTGPIPNTVGNASPMLAIQEVRFPIGASTRYQHQQKTVLDANSRHRWQTTATAPSATAATSVCGGAGTICEFRDITVRQGTQQAQGYVGYAWQGQNNDPSIAPGCTGGGSGQLDQVANLNTDAGNGGANAQNGYVASACGIVEGGLRVAYSLLTQRGKNFYLDTTDITAPMLRQIVLEPQPAITPPASGGSWGVLNFASDALLLHPAGHLVSINKTLHKIETHRLPAVPLADADAKVALLAQPKSGRGSRPGLIDTPAAAAISADGVILVLEAGNNQIQAFDLGANPVRHFKNQKSPYSLILSATDPQAQWSYLDLAVEYTGFIYVLSYNTGSYVYRLDIYHPAQSGSAPIATTLNVNAARLTVDFWRNVYTLNYEVMMLPGGSAAPRTEPSISLWTPCSAGQTCSGLYES
ncbi:MAG: hypothetical protein ABI212_08015 [Burkholderiaceae bacterium]